MLILQIKRLVSYQSNPLPEGATSWTDGAHKATQFVGKHPSNPQTGTVTIDVRVVEGTFDGIHELLFIALESKTAKLISARKQWLGGYRIVVDFETVFYHGLQYMASQMLPQGGGIIGLTAETSKGMDSYDVQHKLLQMLAKMILPKRANTILQLARPSVHLIPLAEKSTHTSHLTGRPQLPAGTPIPHDNSGIPLFHLGTLTNAELPHELQLGHLTSYISFYLRTHLDGPWPYREKDFVVLASDELATDTSDAAYDQPVYVEFKQLLEIPRRDHSSIQLVNLSEDESDAYEALESTYKSILDPEYDFHTYSKLGGYPDNVQRCVAYEAELIRNNREYGEEAIREAVQWKLLLQMIPEHPSFTFTETFGDGCIYYMIKADDLKRGDLSNVQVVIQNT